MREPEIRGAHAPSRARFGALAETPSARQLVGSLESEKVRDREGAIASTRGACAPLSCANEL